MTMYKLLTLSEFSILLSTQTCSNIHKQRMAPHAPHKVFWLTTYSIRGLERKHAFLYLFNDDDDNERDDVDNGHNDEDEGFKNDYSRNKVPFKNKYSMLVSYNELTRLILCVSQSKALLINFYRLHNNSCRLILKMSDI